MLKNRTVLRRYHVPAHKGGLAEPQVLDELVHLVGECTSRSPLADPFNSGSGYVCQQSAKFSTQSDEVMSFVM